MELKQTFCPRSARVLLWGAICLLSPSFFCSSSASTPDHGSTSLTTAYIFPNPVKVRQSAFIHIEPVETSQFLMQIYDVSGKIVLKTQLRENDSPGIKEGGKNYEVNLGGLRPGVYCGVLTAESNGGLVLRKTFRFSVVG